MNWGSGQDEVLEGLRAGRTLAIQRKDDPILPYIMELQGQGLVTTEVDQFEEQSSRMLVRPTRKLLHPDRTYHESVSTECSDFPGVCEGHPV